MRQHGVSKRRTWLKLHLAVDETSGEILAAVVSTNDWTDSEILPELVEQIEDEIEQVSADGAYDTSNCYDTLTERGAKPVIPPRKTAVIWQHGNAKAPPNKCQPRGEKRQPFGGFYGAAGCVMGEEERHDNSTLMRLYRGSRNISWKNDNPWPKRQPAAKIPASPISRRFWMKQERIW